MATITLIDLSTPNDGLGDPLRDGGTIINDNFNALNNAKLEAGAYLGNAQDLFNLIEANQLALTNSPRLNTNNVFTGQNSFPVVQATDIDGSTVTFENSLITPSGNPGIDTSYLTSNGDTLNFSGGVLISIT